MKISKLIKEDILQKVVDYYYYTQLEKEQSNKINYAGRVYDSQELINLVDSSLEFYLTPKSYCKKFEEKFSQMFDIKYCNFVNSGSSANLLAFLSLTSHELGDRKINRGDEVITIAYAFPTTISPIILFGAVPVFVDIEFDNIDISQLELALSEKTKAVFVAHTLGNPFKVKEIKDFCDKHNLWLIQDSCDSLGAKYDGKNIEYYGDILTYSFYPAHHITCGQGGMVATNCEILSSIIHSIRDWGRFYNCTQCSSLCEERYFVNSDFGLDEYDCRYTYSHYGLNVAGTEMQAAIGLAQLDKFENFCHRRKENFEILYHYFEKFQDYFILPKATENSEPSRFAFLITLRPDVKFFKRIDLVQFFEFYNIETRMMFAGNILKQKCSQFLVKDKDYRQIGDLPNTQFMSLNSFFVGIYPGLTTSHMEFIGETVKKFLNKN